MEGTEAHLRLGNLGFRSECPLGNPVLQFPFLIPVRMLDKRICFGVFFRRSLLWLLFGFTRSDS